MSADHVPDDRGVCVVCGCSAPAIAAHGWDCLPPGDPRRAAAIQAAAHVRHVRETLVGLAGFAAIGAWVAVALGPWPTDPVGAGLAPSACAAVFAMRSWMAHGAAHRTALFALAAIGAAAGAPVVHAMLPASHGGVPAIVGIGLGAAIGYPRRPWFRSRP